MNEAPTIEDARREAMSFHACLPKSLNAASFTPKSKVPFRAMALREALIHRVSSLADGAISEVDSGRWLAASVLVRALAETAAALCALEKQLDKALRTSDDLNLHEFLTRAMVGTKNDPNGPVAFNVMTFIDRAEKEFPGFGKGFNDLCEFAHPNWAGVLGAFSHIDEKTYEVTFAPFSHSNIDQTIVAALMGSLVIAKHSYNNAGQLIADLNDAFDSGKITYD